MNARMAPPNKAQLHIAAERYHNPYADCNSDLQDLSCHAMDRAIGIQKASLAAMVKMQSNVIEMQKQACGSEPVFGELFDGAAQALATCVEIQLSWLNLMVNCAKQGAELWFQLAAMGTQLASSPLPQAQPRMETEEESISLGVGAA